MSAYLITLISGYAVLVILFIYLFVAWKSKQSKKIEQTRKVVHDIRSVLASIKTRSEVERLNTNLPADTKEAIDGYIDDVNRISEMLNRLMM